MLACGLDSTDCKGTIWGPFVSAVFGWGCFRLFLVSAVFRCFWKAVFNSAFQKQIKTAEKRTPIYSFIVAFTFYCTTFRKMQDIDADNEKRRHRALPFDGIVILDLLAAILPMILEDWNDDDPIPYHDSILSGQRRYDEIMNSENDHRFLDECRMSKHVFLLFVDFMRERGLLSDSVHICAGQKLMIFLTLLKGGKNREIHSMWQHSGSTISKILGEVSNNNIIFCYS
jgi:hypothetical protein